MLKRNPVQFSVVREDPEIELGLMRKFRLRAPVMIGSGGCTAFAIAGVWPGVPVALIEPNPAQIDLIRAKVRRLTRDDAGSRARDFGVGRPDDSFIERGNFESLFRHLREFLYEFVVDRREVRRLLEAGTAREWRRVFVHLYWPVAFDLFLSNSLLLTMFGPAAIQHAPRESYPAYFRKVFERGLLRPDRRTNYFLHHLMLGQYLPGRAPEYLSHPPRRIELTFHRCLAQDFASYAGYDLVGLSNIFDWSSAAEVKEIARKLTRELTSGAVVIYRQLNNAKDFRGAFGRRFTWLDDEAARLHRRDRSLFYSSLHVARKV